MDISWNLIGNPVPKNSIEPVTGPMDPNVGTGNICGSEVLYHNIYENECDYTNREVKVQLPARKPIATMVSASLEGTSENIINPVFENNNSAVDGIKDALFQTVSSANETERPVQVFDVKEHMTVSDLPWWKNPIEIINFKAIFNKDDERTYNQTTNYYVSIVLLSVLGSLLLFGILQASILVIISIVVIAIISLVRRTDNESKTSTEGFKPRGLQTSVSENINYLPPMAPCETPAGVVDELSPEILRKERPDFYQSTNQNYWAQANRQLIKKVCPTTAEHGEGIRFIYGDTVKRHIFY